MSRRFEIFLDGTWKREDSPRPTNVSRLYHALLPDPDTHRLYLPGVGTGWLRLTGALFGIGLSRQVKEAYSWLRGHRPTREDRVTITGYSRGAYAARDLSAMLYFVGMQSADVDLLYRQYVEKHHDRETSAAVAVTPRIAHLLCFDTVGALGVPSPLGYTIEEAGLHSTALSPLVEAATHLVARHETRRHFEPTLFPANDQDRVLEIWCPGVHSDIGGGGEHDYFSSHAFLLGLTRLRGSGSKFRHDQEGKEMARLSRVPSALRRHNETRSSCLLPDRPRVPPLGAKFARWSGAVH
jgi:uncharacterized protein (DUF2235 family)